ncbi:MAG TPA: hypothetical protein VFB21_11210 [Chthonomonadaceae bacterium]|nr:hypothetical protein [Chthonomonadaceae bacterium]
MVRHYSRLLVHGRASVLFSLLMLACLAAQPAQAAYATLSQVGVSFGTGSGGSDAVAYFVDADWSGTGLYEKEQVIFHATYNLLSGGTVTYSETVVSDLNFSHPISALRTKYINGLNLLSTHHPPRQTTSESYYYEIAVQVLDGNGQQVAYDTKNTVSRTVIP